MQFVIAILFLIVLCISIFVAGYAIQAIIKRWHETWFRIHQRLYHYCVRQRFAMWVQNYHINKSVHHLEKSGLSLRGL